MVIKNKYLYYKTLGGFTSALQNGYISSDSIAFIEDAQLIWTHGILYGGSNGQIDDDLSTTSENAVQNKVVTAAISAKADSDELKYYSTKNEFKQFADSIDAKLNKSKGYFSSQAALLEAFPNPTVGEWAIVQKGERVVVFQCLEDGIWADTNKNYDTTIDLSEYVKAKYLEDYIKKKDAQEKLVSGVNIKTINGRSILGSGDMLVANGSSKDGTKHVFVTQGEYDSMPEHDINTIYFVYDGTTVEDWGFGDKLPIILK